MIRSLKKATEACELMQKEAAASFRTQAAKGNTGTASARSNVTSIATGARYEMIAAREILVEAIDVQTDLVRRLSDRAASAALRKELLGYERLIGSLAADYGLTIDEYVSAVQAQLKAAPRRRR